MEKMGYRLSIRAVVAYKAESVADVARKWLAAANTSLDLDWCREMPPDNRILLMPVQQLAVVGVVFAAAMTLLSNVISSYSC
jgi:hypothetical protein